MIRRTLYSLCLLFSLVTLSMLHAPHALAAQSAPDAQVAEKASDANTSTDAADAAADSDADAAEFTMPALETIGFAKPWQLGFQTPSSPVKEALDSLHTGLTILMTVIVIFVTILLAYVCIRFRAKRNPVPSKVSHNTTIEIIWTVIPILILIGIAIPTLRLHYGLVYNFEDSDMTIKVTGHQWYWSYEYPKEGISFDSNMKKKEELSEGEPYLLAVDNPVVVPVGKKISIEMTSADVIHSWAIPALGVKRDTVPGRLNQTHFTVKTPGIYYGQCSELCGKLHGFMPIAIYALEEKDYKAWVKHAKQKFALNEAGELQLAAR